MNDDAAAAGTAVRPPFSIQPSSQLHYYKTGPSQSSRRPPFAPSPSGSREPTHGQDRGDSASARIGVANAAADSQGNPATHWPPPRSSSLAFEPPPEINELAGHSGSKRQFPGRLLFISTQLARNVLAGCKRRRGYHCRRSVLSNAITFTLKDPAV